MSKVKLSREEKQLLQAVESGEYESTLSEARKKELEITAANTFRKDKRINIRISKRDLMAVRSRALEEGIPYQTLVSSIIHKYISGSLKDVSADKNWNIAHYKPTPSTQKTRNYDMPSTLTSRRRALQQMAALAVLSALPGTALAGLITRTPKASPFDDNSTAEEVTAGLDLSGKTFAITGANSGLGYETMRVLALRGAHVIGIARTREKADKACAGIDGETTPEFLDLADWDSVVACAERIRAMGMPLDGLITNAGIMALPELELVNGVEKQFAVNHLGHFILVNQLQEPVLAAPQGRFVMLSSKAHRAAENGIEFDNLDGSRHYDPWTAYGVSKLANALCSRELASRISHTNATSNSVHPGVIATNLGKHLPEWQRTAMKYLGWIFMKTIPEGAATTCYVATSPDLVGVRGFYFADCQVDEGDTPYVYDDAMASKLWQVSKELTRPYLPVTRTA
jgi:NAD(P)-dependent dehydrogenase (short-subunit alcohol dehydrogenase family)/predicted DNA binding CopG/RHH family protein